MQQEHVFHTFEPVFNSESRILILGTFPSVKSRENNFYYGHKQNRFWKVIALLCDTSVPESIEQKKKLLLDNHIAVWDVIDNCDIEGSSDNSIRNVLPTQLEIVLNEANISKIYANGAKAYELYNRYQREKTGIQIIKLPSTSPANAAIKLDALIEQWRIITQ